jgi:hypothetical protein
VASIRLIKMEIALALVKVVSNTSIKQTVKIICTKILRNRSVNKMTTKQKLIDSGISESCIAVQKCPKCNGILVGQKSILAHPILTCVDCGTAYKVKE